MSSIVTKQYIIDYVSTHLWELTKDDLFWLYEDRENKPKKSLTKDALVQRIKEDGFDMWEIYQKCKSGAFGIYPTALEDMLGINKRQRLKLAKHGWISVAYTRESRAYGSYIDVPYYSLEALMELSHEDIQEWKEKKDRKATPKQLAAIEKAHQAKLLKRTCKVCNRLYDNASELNADRVCRNCIDMRDSQIAYNKKLSVIKNIVANNERCVVIHAETTSLDSCRQAVSVCITNLQGDIIFDEILKVTKPIDPGASACHHITQEDINNEGVTPLKLKYILKQLSKEDKIFLVYNRDFVMEAIVNLFKSYNYLLTLKGKAICVMNYIHRDEWISVHKLYNYQELRDAFNINSISRAAHGCLSVVKFLDEQSIKDYREVLEW